MPHSRFFLRSYPDLHFIVLDARDNSVTLSVAKGLRCSRDSSPSAENDILLLRISERVWMLADSMFGRF